MVLIRAMLVAAAVLIGLAGLATGSSAHQNHQQAKAAAARPAPAAPGAVQPPSEAQQQMEAHMDAMADEQPKTFWGRLVSWFGRMHPFAVHFPIALFPVALVALVLARRRGETVELIRGLIVVGGAASVLAAGLGWLNGGLTLTDTDDVLMYHRWLGTFLGLIGALVGWWAWRRRASVHGGWMVGALGAIVALLLVQGFLGASVTHGMEHMMF